MFINKNAPIEYLLQDYASNADEHGNTEIYLAAEQAIIDKVNALQEEVKTLRAQLALTATTVNFATFTPVDTHKPNKDFVFTAPHSGTFYIDGQMMYFNKGDEYVFLKD